MADVFFSPHLFSSGSEGRGDGAFRREVSRLFQKTAVIQAFVQKQVTQKTIRAGADHPQDSREGEEETKRGTSI